MQSVPIHEPDPVSYTVKIGVTGHRDLPQIQTVSESVGKLLLQLKDSLETGMKDLYQPLSERSTKWQRFESLLSWKAGKTLARCKMIPRETPADRLTPLKWEIFSSLARGADQIAAREAMEKLQAQLITILPCELHQYAKDFTTPEDLEEFHELVQKSANCKTLFTEPSTFTGSRDEQYEQAGKLIVDSCELLLAVWDGNPARGKGGTADIVSYACSIGRPVIWINALNPGAVPEMIEKIEVLRSETDPEQKERLHIKKRSLPLLATGWSHSFMQVAGYNRDRSFKIKDFEKIYNSNLTKLQKAGDDAGLPDAYFMPLLETILPHYARADCLATRYQSLHKRAATWLYRLTATAVTAAVVQALYFPSGNVLVIAEILFLLVAVLWFRTSQLEQWHEKWLNYRHLAERTRIFIFHSLTGTSLQNESWQDRHLPFYAGPGNWVSEVLDSIQYNLPLSVIPNDLFPEVKQFIAEGWLSDQADYHRENAAHKEQKVHLEHGITGILLMLTFSAALIHLLGLLHDKTAEKFIVLLVIVLPAFAAAQHAISGIRDYERIAARSARMKDILWSIRQRLVNTGNWSELASEIQHSEEIMAAENIEWSASLSFRRISLPV